jgi:hypothetical protein
VANNFYLFPGLELAPLTYERLIGAIPELRWDEKIDPDRFTLREAIAHVADWEPILLERLRTAVESPGSAIEAYDEGQRALDMNYNQTAPLEQVGLFRQKRAETVRFLRGLSTEKWSNTFIHPERGEISVADLANMLLGHDHYHLEHLSQLLG